MDDQILCPICDRIIPSSVLQKHHLIPKTFKGRDTIPVHSICHQKLHATFSERDMFQYYHTVERLVEHDEIQKFVMWVKKKDPTFYTTNRDTKERRRKR